MSAPIFSHSVRRALAEAAGGRAVMLADAVTLEGLPEGDTDEARALFRSIGRDARISLDGKGCTHEASETLRSVIDPATGDELSFCRCRTCRAYLVALIYADGRETTFRLMTSSEESAAGVRS